MKTTKVNYNVKKMARMTDNESLNFSYPIQRAGGQWDDLQKSLLIHSIVGDYPIPPLLTLATGDGVEYVLDGKQRTLNIIDFIMGIKNPETGKYPANAYPLHQETPSVTVSDVEGEFELAGKYFDELDEVVQTEIMGANVSISRLEDATDEEIAELFFRWNNGTPLTKQQKARAKMGVAHAEVVDALQNHKFLLESASFTKLQRRRSDDEAVILQTLILMDDEVELESFVADKLLSYAKGIHDRDIVNATTKLKEALDYASSANTTSPLFKKLHLPMVLMVAYKAKQEDIDPIVFGAWVDDFNNAINARTRDKALVKSNYKNWMGAGSVKKDKVEGRINAMTAHFNEFIDRYELPVIEEQLELTVAPPTTEFAEESQVVNESSETNKESTEKQPEEVVEVTDETSVEDIVGLTEETNDDENAKKNETEASDNEVKADLQEA